MACNCQKTCKKDICCSVCPEVKECEDRCRTCVPDKTKKEEEAKDDKGS